MAYATINKGSSYFNTLLWTGNGNSTRSLTGVEFKPDWVWIKSRSGAYSHHLFDIVRGVEKALQSNSSNAESNQPSSGYLTAFNSDGFSVSQGSSSATNVNENGTTYVSWNWLGANTTVSNTAGTITSTVSANTTSGFSVVTYTGNGNASATFGHGIGATPKLVIIKNRGDVESWQTFVNNNIRILLDSTASNYGNYPISTSSTLVTTPSTVDGGWNGNTKTYVAYCFAEVKGFSKIGTYTGNGNADGTFVYTGFKPALVLQKTTSTTSDWNIVDNKRSTYNVNNLRLNPNTSSAESTSPDYCDLLSNGFKFRASSSGINGSGETNIYAAFAENPFVLTDGTPVTAR